LYATGTMTHYTDKCNSAISSLTQERFQGTLEDWHGTHRLEFFWRPATDSGDYHSAICD